VDTYIDNGELDAAVPLLWQASERILAGDNKRTIWTCGGTRPCPLSSPVNPSVSQGHAVEAGNEVEQASGTPHAIACDYPGDDGDAGVGVTRCLTQGTTEHLALERMAHAGVTASADTCDGLSLSPDVSRVEAHSREMPCMEEDDMLAGPDRNTRDCNEALGDSLGAHMAGTGAGRRVGSHCGPSGVHLGCMGDGDPKDRRVRAWEGHLIAHSAVCSEALLMIADSAGVDRPPAADWEGNADQLLAPSVGALGGCASNAPHADPHENTVCCLVTAGENLGGAATKASPAQWRGSTSLAPVSTSGGAGGGDAEDAWSPECRDHTTVALPTAAGCATMDGDPKMRSFAPHAARAAAQDACGSLSAAAASAASGECALLASEPAGAAGKYAAGVGTPVATYQVHLSSCSAASCHGAASVPSLQGKARDVDRAGTPETPELPGVAAIPLFLARFDAVWIYAELATMYVSHVEKLREYELACNVLRALLGGSACPSRRYAFLDHVLIVFRVA
jgi:hypothetical protein